MHIKLRNRIISDARRLAKEADSCERKERKYTKIDGKKSFAIISKRKVHGNFIVGKGSSLRIAKKRYKEAKASQS